MEYVLSLSYGKDSLACLGAIEELGWPLDRIVHAEVWATDTIPADLPPMVEFKAKADEIVKKRWGIEVEHFSVGHSFEDEFYYIKHTSKYREHNDTIYGWPMQRCAWCNWHLKLPALRRAERGGISYIGIACDEPKRIAKLDDTHRSPLYEAKWTEAKCRKWCEDNDLLSPIYSAASRGGCWFCHNQRVEQLRFLRKKYPEYWGLMLKWDKDSPVSFKPDGHTVHDFDRRFQMEDEGFVYPDELWRWEYLDSDLINYRLF